jgi:HAD superfamily hydrolase (TIGR01509 family)
MIKAVLFDLDGVLVDAVELHQKAFLEAVKPHRNIDEIYHMKELNGIPTRKKLEKLNFYKDEIARINDLKQEITFRLIPEVIKPIPEVIRVVEELKKNNIPFAVCSNSIRKSTEMLIEFSGVEGAQFLISNQEVMNPKPDPEMYHKAMKRLELEKEEVLIVEDSPVGIKAAKSSGACVCEIKNPYDIEKVLMTLKEHNSTFMSEYSLGATNKFNLNTMTRGWFVGDFDPSAFKTKDCEVAVMKYRAGDSEARHIHKVATELTAVVKGKIRMNGVEYSEGDIVVIKPGEATDFEALTDAIDVVVKVPSAKGDKYLVED